MKKVSHKSYNIKVSKFLSFILRHNLFNYGLSFDKYGFVDFESILKIIKKKFPKIEKEDIENIVYKDPNMRFQIKGKKIRARYGHSLDVEPLGDNTKDIPDILFHGTSPKNLKSILRKGLKPQKRKFVHLSSSIEEAKRVGRRKSNSPIVLKIDVRKAIKDGFVFIKEGKVFLVEDVPARYISILDQ